MDRKLMSRAVLLVASLGLTLAACEGGGDPVRQAQLDALAANQAAVIDGATARAETTATDGPAAGSDLGSSLESAGPPVTGAIGSKARDQAFVTAMIDHQNGAIAMAEGALAQSDDPEIRRVAQGVIARGTAEIAELRTWRPSIAPAATSTRTEPQPATN